MTMRDILLSRVATRSSSSVMSRSPVLNGGTLGRSPTSHILRKRTQWRF